MTIPPWGLPGACGPRHSLRPWGGKSTGVADGGRRRRRARQWRVVSPVGVTGRVWNAHRLAVAAHFMLTRGGDRGQGWGEQSSIRLFLCHQSWVRVSPEDRTQKWP